MKLKNILIIVGALLFLVLVAVIIGRIVDSANKEQEDLHLERQTFAYKDKDPGGCYVAFTALPTFFYDTKPEVITKPFAVSVERNQRLKGANNFYMLVASRVFTSKEDVDAMMDFVERGNQLFIAANYLDTLLVKRLDIKISEPLISFFDSAYVCRQRYINPLLMPDTFFTRQEIREGTYFRQLDTPKTTILGTDGFNNANFVKMYRGKGQIFLMLQPSTLTNYFLLYKKNLASLENQMGYVDIYNDHIYWDEFYKYQRYRSSPGDFSDWQVLMRYPALRWALWLLVALLLLYVLFESKRRQRIIPDKPVLTNNSLEFVEAMGQLYFQQHDNVNLARKITAQWFENIRNRYYINTNTSQLNDQFIRRLAHKSGATEESVQEIVNNIQFIQIAEKIGDDYLQKFYKNIQAFYLNTK